MSKIIFETQDFNLIPSPSLNEFILGVDIDGIPKLKRANDTLVLGVNESAIITYQSVTYLQFLSLINTSSLVKGNVYLINNFYTRHYLQYTDTNGDGTSNNEVIYTGSIEPIVLVATSNNTYNPEVKSLLYPNDIIIWQHTLLDRERDYVGDGNSRGCITYRRSETGNARDYDFRQVMFRRWNDGLGNYRIIRKIEAPNPNDFQDFFSMIESPTIQGFQIGSFPSTYFMDNVVLSTTYSVDQVKIGKGVNSNIGATLSLTKIDYLERSLIQGYFQNSHVGNIIGSTFTGIFNDNEFLTIIDSQLNQATHNRVSVLTDINISVLEDNQGVTFSSLVLNIVQNNQISYLNNQLGNTNIIGNKMDIYTGNNLSGDVTYNTIHIFQNNTGSGLINYNQGLEWIGNTFNGDVIGNSINYLLNNSTMSLISDNFIATMVNNNGGTYTGNNGLEFMGNTCSLVIDNQLQYFNANDISIVQHNIGYLFSNNIGVSYSTISDNIVSEMSSNILTESGLIHNNQGTSIVNNSIYSILSNTTTEILNNGCYEINHNIGNLIQDNIGLFGTGSISFNNVLEVSNNSNFDHIINNQGNEITNNISATISGNQVGNITNNITNLITENIGNLIGSNNNAIIYQNQVTLIENNVGNLDSTLQKNISTSISGNTLFDQINGNKTLFINNNTTINILDNQAQSIINNLAWTNINNNISQSIQNNIINTLIGTASISYNNILEINDNQDIGTISYNNGTRLNNNLFLDDVTDNIVGNLTNNFNLKNLKSNEGPNIIGVTGSIIGAGPYVGSAAFSSTITFTGIDYTSSFNPGDVVVITGATDGTFSVISDLFTSSNTYLTINQSLNVLGSVSVTKIADKLYSLESLKSSDLKWVQLNDNIIRHTMLDSIEYKSLTPTEAMKFATYSTTSRYLFDSDNHYEERANFTGLTWSGPIT